MKNRVLTYVGQKWQQYLIYGAALAAATSVLLFQLYKFAPYASPSEEAARDSARTFVQLIDNPLFLPHKVLQLFANIIGMDSLLVSRGISALFGLIAVLFFYRVIRTWYTSRVALLGSGLFVTASWFLHTSRMATPTVLYLLSIALIWAGLRVVGNNQRQITLFLIGGVTIFLLFVPGFVWLLLAAAIWQRKRIVQEIKRLRKPLAAALAFGTLIVIGILGQAFARDPSLLLTWLGAPETFVAKDAASNFLLTPYYVFVRAPYNPEIWLGRLPYVNIAITLLFGLGSFVMYRSIALDRIRALLGILVIGSLLAALGGPVSLVIVLPLICVAATAGIALLLQQWFTVFPRNPIARGFGVLCVSMLVAFSAGYSMYQYFEAWPRNPDVQEVYTTQSQR